MSRRTIDNFSEQAHQDVTALVRLLDDPNPDLAAQAGDALVEYGALALPALRAYADQDPARATALAQRIEARLLETEWAALARQPDAESAALLLARWRDPLLDPDHIRAQLDALAEPLRGTILGGTSALDYRRDALVLREWLARVKRFRGTVSDYYHPDNSLLPRVLERRYGIPLALALVYLFVARRLGAPLVPIGTPGHFLVRYGDADKGIYLDPYHEGALLSVEDCDRLLARYGHRWHPAYATPISDHAMVERMLRNLVNAFAARQDEHAVAQVVKYFEVWTDHHAGG